MLRTPTKSASTAPGCIRASAVTAAVTTAGVMGMPEQLWESLLLRQKSGLWAWGDVEWGCSAPSVERLRPVTMQDHGLRAGTHLAPRADKGTGQPGLPSCTGTHASPGRQNITRRLQEEAWGRRVSKRSWSSGSGHSCSVTGSEKCAQLMMQRKDTRWFSLHCLTGKPAIKCAGREGRRKEREDTKTNPSVFGWVCVIMEILSEVIYKVLWVFKIQSAKPQDGSPQGHPGFLLRNSHGLWSGRPSQPHVLCQDQEGLRPAGRTVSRTNPRVTDTHSGIGRLPGAQSAHWEMFSFTNRLQ